MGKATIWDLFQQSVLWIFLASHKEDIKIKKKKNNHGEFALSLKVRHCCPWNPSGIVKHEALNAQR